MANYVIDWNGNPNGASYINLTGAPNTLTAVGGTSTVNVTVNAPPSPNAVPNAPVNGPGGTYPAVENWYIHNYIGTPDGELVAQYVNEPVPVTIGFPSPMTNITFDLYDIDRGGTIAAGTGWSDQVTIYAIDAAGNPVPATINVLPAAGGVPITPGTIAAPTVNGVHTVGTDGTNTVIGAIGNNDPLVNGAGAPDSVSISIAGPISGFVVVYNTGGGYATSGVVGIGPISFTDPTPPCFVRGTLIATDKGEVAVEDLCPGDMVRTLDNGFQPLSWVGSTTVRATGEKAPIRFRKGVIGNTSDLLVSPAHRVMIQDWQAEILFGDKELLAAAQSLVNDCTITRQDMEEVEYFHILFDRHEIVFANGAPTESFHPGDADVGIMARESREEILRLFPQLAQDKGSYGPSVRATLRPSEAALLSL
jgi:hypothetical protein